MSLRAGFGGRLLLREDIDHVCDVLVSITALVETPGLVETLSIRVVILVEIKLFNLRV